MENKSDKNSNIAKIKEVIFNPKIFIGLFLFFSKKHKFLLTTRIQKAYFLFVKEIFKSILETIYNKQLDIFSLDSDKDGDFIACNFGPYSKDIDFALSLYESSKIINTTTIETKYSKESIDFNSNYKEKNAKKYIHLDDDNWKDQNLWNEKKFFCYELNSKYIPEFKETIKKISSLFADEIISNQFWVQFKLFVEKINETDINKILFYVYNKYPNYTTKSLIKKKVLNNE